MAPEGGGATGEAETTRDGRGGIGPSVAQVARLRRFARKFRRNTKAMVGLTIVVGLVVAAIFARPIVVEGFTLQPFSLAPYPYAETNIPDRTQAPSLAHPFGTDDLGRDIFSRVVVGSRISLKVGFGAISAALAVGAVIGVVAGYAGGLTDELLMRLMDAAMAFPPVLLALTLLVVLGPELDNVIIALAFVYTPFIARVSRGAALAERNEAYVEAAVARGESSPRIVFGEVFPNCTAPMLVQGSLNVSFAILAEASLSFLGLGAQPPNPSWGLMINTGRGFMESAPWMLLFPALAIGIAVIGFNMLGDGLRDVLDPKVEAIE